MLIDRPRSASSSIGLIDDFLLNLILSKLESSSASLSDLVVVSAARPRSVSSVAAFNAINPQLVLGLNRSNASSASISDPARSVAAFGRTSPSTLTDLSLSVSAFNRGSTAAFNAINPQLVLGLFRSEGSAASISDSGQRVAAFRRTSPSTLTDPSQGDSAFNRGSTAAFNFIQPGLTQALFRPDGSIASVTDVARSVVTFPRTSAVTLLDPTQSIVTFPRSSVAAFASIAPKLNFGLHPITPPDTAAITDQFGIAAAFRPATAVALGDGARSEVTFPRGSAASLSDLGTTAVQGLQRSPNPSIATFSDSFFFNQALNRLPVSAFAMASTARSSVTFPRGSSAGLADLFSFGFGPSVAALKESVVLTVVRNFIPPTPAPVPPTPTPAPIPTQPPSTGGGAGGGAGGGGGAPISSIPGGGTLATDIVAEGSNAGTILTIAARLDPKSAGIQLAIAANVSPAASAAALIEAIAISNSIEVGAIAIAVAAAAEFNPVSVGNALVHAARIDALITGQALVAASEADALAISKAILAAARIDPGVIQASMQAGSTTAIGALAALGTKVSVESFVSENTPIEGTDPSTGEVWEVVAPPSASVAVLAKFARGNSEARVDVINVFQLPPDVAPLPEGEIPNSFFQIEGENFDQEMIRATHVTYSVSKAWMLENDIHPWSVNFNRYNEENEAWQTFPGKRVREDEFFVYYTATPPGFSLWAISGRTTVKEVGFRVDNLTIDPPQVREFQEVTVRAEVVNLGDTTMNHSASLWLNGRVQATKVVEVPPNATTPVSFSMFPREGAYEVRLDRQVRRLIVGQAPPPPSNSTVLVLGNASTTRTVTVANPAEGAPLEYVITTDQPWLTANPFTFSLRPGTFQPVALSVNRTGLEPGSYSGQAVISFTGLISGFSLVTVSMDVSEAAVDPVVTPTLNLGPGGISGTTIVSNPLSESALLYTVTSLVPWLNVETSSFVLGAGASQAIILTADRGALDIGFHTGLVTISYSGAISGSSVVAVELEVPPPPPPPLIPPVVNARLDLGATGTGGIITVSTPPSGGPLEYTVTSNAPWLTASPSTFVLSPGESRPVTLSVDRSGLEFGRYAAEITISFDGSTSGSSLVPVTIEMAGSAFPTEGRGLDTWALVLIGLGGAALLWIIVSQATLRLSGAGSGPVRPRGAATPLGAGAQLDFGIEAPTIQPAGDAVASVETGITSALGKALLAITSGVGQTARNAGQRWFSRTPSAVGPPAAPYAEPTEEADPTPITASQSREPDFRARFRIPYSENGAFPALGSRVQAVGASVSRLLSSAATTSAWTNAARLTGRIALEIGKRLDVGVLAYLLSLPLLGVMVLLLLLKAVGVGTGLSLVPIIIIAIVASIVFISTRIGRTRSGNIRRAESTADFLDEDRA